LVTACGGKAGYVKGEECIGRGGEGVKGADDTVNLCMVAVFSEEDFAKVLSVAVPLTTVIAALSLCVEIGNSLVE
jgi:hypothetical protein